MHGMWTMLHNSRRKAALTLGVFKCRHYRYDVISVKTNLTVEKEEGVCLNFVLNKQVAPLSALSGF